MGAPFFILHIYQHLGTLAHPAPCRLITYNNETLMKSLYACTIALACLSGCASSTTTTDSSTAAVEETTYQTGSNIPRKKGTTALASMTPEQAEEMRRAIDAQKTQGR